MDAVNYNLTTLCSCFKTLCGALDGNATFDKNPFHSQKLSLLHRRGMYVHVQ